jgi:hypothetical protein
MPTFCDRLCDSDLEAIEAIRSACHGLLPNWQRPEAFFLQRSAITGGLTKLLRLLGNDPRQLNGRRALTRAFPPTRSSSAASRAQAAALARQVFHPPPAAPAPLALTPPPEVLEAPKSKPRSAGRGKRHRYPLPPREVPGQSELFLAGQ